MSRTLVAALCAFLLQPLAAIAQNMPGPSGDEKFLVGRLCTFSGGGPSASSSYSRQNWALFDGKGNYRYGSETAFSSGAGIAYGQGSQRAGVYRMRVDVIDLYDADGGVDSARIVMRQGNGRITEVMHGDELYAVQLCPSATSGRRHDE